jgi:hypothetical protein
MALQQSRQGREYSRQKRAFMAQWKAAERPCVICGGIIDYSLPGNHPWGPTFEHIGAAAVAITGKAAVDHPEDAGPAHHQCNSRGGGRRKRKRPEPEPERPVRRRAEDPPENVPWVAPYEALQRLGPPPPEAAVMPTEVSEIPEGVTGSHGWDLIDWYESEFAVRNQPLRWWQRYTAIRLLEHDENGALWWSEAAVSTPRRAGKSVLLRALALWRIQQAERFGEEQTVLMTAKDLPIVREIIRRAWPYAEADERFIDGWTVKRLNGSEEIQTGARLLNSRWLVRGKNSVYGYDCNTAIIDESWGVEQTVLDDGMSPAILERVQPQIFITSTAHSMATGLMPDRMAAGRDPSTRTLIVYWGAVSLEVDHTDPSIWRACSPHWTPEREQWIRQRLAGLEKGETDASGLETGVQAFRSQILNTWPPRKLAEDRGLISRNQFDAIEIPEIPRGAPLVAIAVESDYGDQAVDIARVWRLPDGMPVVEVQTTATAAEAARAISGQIAGLQHFLAGATLTYDPGFAAAEAKRSTTTAAADEWRRMARDRVFRISAGSNVIAQQALSVKIEQTAAGLRLKGYHRLAGVKASAWALRAVLETGEAAAIY